MKLTIGMPTHRDYYGVSNTIMDLIMYQDLNSNDEILVIDNSVDDDKNYHSAEIQRFIKNTTGKSNRSIFKNVPNIRYVQYTENQGTAAAKNKVFEEAAGDVVICIDSHEKFLPNTIKQAREFFIQNKDSKDLYTGPLLYNNGAVSTHFDNRWRGQMWGTWGADMVKFLQGQPFEVWGNGCGLLVCNKHAWLGFNPHMKGFGGEEGYIHEKYRIFGHKVICLPWFAWWHQFGKPSPKQYRVRTYDKTRNYLLGFLELGLDIKDIYNHFVSLEIPEGQSIADHLQQEHSVPISEILNKTAKDLHEIHQRYKIPQKQWEYLLEDPINHTDPMIILREKYKSKDVGVHFDVIKDLASKCSTLSEITRRSETVIPLIESGCKNIKSYIYDVEPINIKETAHVTKYKIDKFITAVDNCDLLFIKFPHEINNMCESLKSLSANVNRFIIIHDAKIDYKPGFGEGLKEFIDSSEWFVHSYYHDQFGLVVLGKLEEDRPTKKVLAWRPDRGPGTELKKMLESVGIKSTQNCSCNAKALQMDLWQVEGCEENYDLIVDWIREGAKKWSTIEEKDENGVAKTKTWSQVINNNILAYGIKSLINGWGFKVNPIDPFPGLVSQAINRAKVYNK